MVLLDRGCAADVQVSSSSLIMPCPVARVASNPQDTAGRTALHLAVCSKEPETFNILNWEKESEAVALKEPQLCKLLLAKSPELAARREGHELYDRSRVSSFVARSCEERLAREISFGICSQQLKGSASLASRRRFAELVELRHMQHS